MATRRGPLAVLCSLLWFVLRCNLAGIAADEDALRRCLADFLGADADAIQLSVTPAGGDGVSAGWARVPGEELPVRFRVQEVGGELCVIQMTRPIAPTDADIGVSAAKQKATEHAEQKYERWGPGMQLTEAKRLPMGPYLFTWKGIWRGTYETGDFVALMLDSATGNPITYAAGYATRAPELPSVDEERAAEIATKHVRRGLGDGVQCSTTHSRCVLSVPWVAGGPVWFFTVEVAGAGLAEQRLVIVDATTGCILQTPSSGTALDR